MGRGRPALSLETGGRSSRITAKFYVPAKIDRLDNSGHLDQLAESAPKT